MESEIQTLNHANSARINPWRFILALLCLSLVFGAIAASHESLWIDEGFSAFFANQPSFSQYLSAMQHEMGSDAQAPLYTAYLWAWRHGFGASEQVLRLANLPWILLGHAVLLVAMARAGLKRGMLVWFTLAAAVSPFLTFYINQARCYGMQYGTACLTLAYLVAISASPRDAFRLPALGMGLLGAVLLCGTSLLGVTWLGSAVLAAAWILWKSREQVERPTLMAWATIALAIILLGLLGYYYLGTLLRGARATGGTTNLGSILFCAYEMFGLAGLGPGRNDLRQLGLQGVLAYGPGLVAGASVVFGTLVWGGLIRFRKGIALTAPVQALGFVLLPLVFMFGMGMANHFRVLGRHIIPVFPLLLFLIAAAMQALFEARRKTLPVLLLIAWATSAGLLRFSERHRRDDYRDAVQIAAAGLAAGKPIWWAADRLTGAYYGLQFVPEKNIWNMMAPSPETLATLPEPALILLSKPDIYDAGQALRDYIAREGFIPTQNFPAFTVFEKRSR